MKKFKDSSYPNAVDIELIDDNDELRYDIKKINREVRDLQAKLYKLMDERIKLRKRYARTLDRGKKYYVNCRWENLETGKITTYKDNTILRYDLRFNDNAFLLVDLALGGEMYIEPEFIG